MATTEIAIATTEITIAETNNNGDGNQGAVNNNLSPSNPTSSYGGSGQFNLIITRNGNSASGVITANINCAVEQNGNNIQLAITLTPTSVSQSLQQEIQNDNSVTFNFAGTTSGSQINANAQETIGSGSTFDLNLRVRIVVLADCFNRSHKPSKITLRYLGLSPDN